MRGAALAEPRPILTRPRGFPCLLGALLLAAVSGLAGDFIAGADFSHLAFFEDRGVIYKDAGRPQDGLAILKARGLTCVRLRLFTSSAAQAAADPYNYTNNLSYTLPLALRVKTTGLQFMLDFHYSDTWADPGHQAKPSVWASLTFSQLVQQTRDYSSNCIVAFKAAGAMPDYVQVGNEITPGLLWPDGRVGGVYDTPAQWSQLGQLLKAAIQGIKDAAGTNGPKIVIHIDRGGDWAATQWFFDHLLAQGVPFDVIGQSYYPFWHGSLEALRACLNNTANRYGKPVLVAETAFPWSGATNIYAFPPTTNGQVDYVAALAQVVKGVPGGRGIGVCWWGAEYVRLPGYNLAGFDQRSFFDFAAEVLPVANAIGQLSAPVKLSGHIAGTNLVLEWPLSGAAMVLKSATNLAPDAAWLTVPSAVGSNEGTFKAFLPVYGYDSPPRFFRLAQ